MFLLNKYTYLALPNQNLIMTQTKLVGLPWKFKDVWNQTLDNIGDRPIVPRDYIYASELGGAFCDRYLKMNAVPMTNPPNVRSRRKFQAGNTWEWLLGIILVASGMLKKRQLRVETKLPRMLRVSGKIDYVAGGDIAWDSARANLENFKESLTLIDAEAPPFFFTAIEKFIDKYSGKLLAEYILETKSVSSYMMEKVQKTGPMDHHLLQDYHYLLGNDQGITEAKLIYVCKDDCIMEEFSIVDSEDIHEIYKEDIRQMTKFYKRGFNKKKPTELMPPKEPEVYFEEGTWRFVKNWRVEYSNYLELLYGLQSPEAFRMKWQRPIASWNRVFKRCVRGDNMTENNKKVISEAGVLFPQWDKYVRLAKADGAFQKPEETEEE